MRCDVLHTSGFLDEVITNVGSMVRCVFS